MTNAWSALAPSPRSGGLLFAWNAEGAKRLFVPDKIKIASWNVNSVRARLGIVERLLREEKPDVVCLQETKATDDVFPRRLFAELGYVHQQLKGQNKPG